MFNKGLETMNRKFLTLALSSALAIPALTASAIALAPTAQAAEAASHTPFTKAAFEAAQREGKPILVDVFAPWCPVCAKQQPAIAAAQTNPANKDLVVFRVDFDDQKDVVRNFRATRQSTLIAYKGGKETGRTVGATNSAEIGKLIASTRS